VFGYELCKNKIYLSEDLKVNNDTNIETEMMVKHFNKFIEDFQLLCKEYNKE
jgi:hypothetical protein